MRPIATDNFHLSMIPTIETERLRLREWRINDFDGYLALTTNTELQRYVLGGAKSKQQAWDDFCAISGQWVLRGVGIFLIADRKTDKARGFTGLWFPLDQEVPELCWSLFPGNMGKGYATEAAIAARQWVYENRQYHQLVSYIHPDNVASCVVAERLGAKLKSRIKLYGEDRLLFLHPNPI
ncbi:MAG: N-acetyltransferase [Gammaproteobacteria bacterium]|nr:MAG: N-acetyltransferase [Gammaproteobacteria bacterium]